MSAGTHLRHVRIPDLEMFFQHQLDSESIQMAAFPSRDRPAFFSHWSKIMVDPAVVCRTIVYNGQVAGNIVSFGDPTKREVGYWLGKEYWGKGIATHALTLFLQQISTRPLYAYVAKHNAGSLKVLQKCGFTIVGEASEVPGSQAECIEEYILKLDA